MLKLSIFVKPHWKKTMIGSLLKLIEAFLELLLPYYMIKIVDIGIVNKDSSYIWMTAGKMLLFATLGLISVVTCHRLAAKVACDVATDIRSKLMEKTSKLSYSQLDTFGTSSLVNRLTIDVNVIRDAVVFLIRLVTRAPFMCIGGIVMGFMVDRKMSLIFVFIIPLFSLFLYIIAKKIVPYQKKMNERVDDLGRHLRENLSGIRVIRAFVRQKEEKKKLGDTIEGLSSTYIVLNNFRAIINPVTIFVLNMAIILILYISGHRVNEGTLSRSQSLALIQYVTQIMFSLVIISNLVTLYTQASASSKRIFEVLDMKQDIEYKKENKYPLYIEETFKNEVEFKNVSFAYVGEKYSIKDVSFSLKKNKTLGIIGATGSGKTTIINLIARFYDIDKGTILYNNMDVRDYKKDELLKSISIIPQKAVLFSGTIAENMRYSKKDATENEIWKAIDAAQAGDFVRGLGSGLDHIVQRGGVNFSGGEKQRLAIARGLLKNPSLLILDDSLSALDYHIDMLFRKTLKSEYSDTTIIIVSQRVSSVMSADDIIVMDNGNIKEQGNHAELISEQGIYYQIHKTQSELEEKNNV